MEKKDKLKKGQKLAEKAIFLETGLALAKGLIGLVSGSVVLISDAVHSASDLVSIITSWLGLKIAQKKPNEKFPYGYYKAENLGTLIISFLIFFAAWKMLSQGYERLFELNLINFAFLALGISLLDALILFFFGRLEIKVGQEIGAESLVAMGKENKTHLFSSLAVFGGILATQLKIPYIEGGVTFIISFLIFKIGLETLKNSVFGLMDVSPEEAIRKKTEKAIASVPGVEEFFDLKLRKAGPFVFGEVKVGIRRFVNLDRADLIAAQIENRVKKKVAQIDALSVQVKPFKSDYRHLVLPVARKNGLNSPLAEFFARAPLFLFVNLKKGKIKSHFFLANPFEKKKVRAGLGVAKLVARQKSEVLLAREIGEISFHALKDSLVDVYQTQAKTAQEGIDQYLKKKSVLLSKATREKES